MSKIGDAPILIPDGVTVEETGGSLVVKGPKGQLQMPVNPSVKLEIKENQIIAKRKDSEKISGALQGLVRSLVANMMIGVTQGWSKNLELIGVGFRAQTDGGKLNLVVGFSHPVEISAPEGILFEVTDNTKIKVSGTSKYLVGQIAANIRAVRPPDVYKGKGIRYEGEYVRKKAGKAGKVGPGAVK